MNAYELADELADELENYVWMNPNNNRDYCKEVKDMLRQQAYRIAELSKNVDELEEELLKEPQIKELSDEEIDEVLYSMDWAHDPVKFARAILKKASEK
jgi:ABC-type Zn uptake system ZnuABC Zn-binding protein ZnuA